MTFYESIKIYSHNKISVFQSQYVGVLFLFSYLLILIDIALSGEENIQNFHFYQDTENRE